MRCERCGTDYPSEYYFRTRSICNNCYDKLTPEEKKAVVEKEPIARGGKMQYYKLRLLIILSLLPVSAVAGAGDAPARSALIHCNVLVPRSPRMAKTPVIFFVLPRRASVRLNNSNVESGSFAANAFTR